jgi:hypothetical protein
MGTTTYERDQLERPTKITDGHGESVSYEYDLDNELECPRFDGHRKLGRLAWQEGCLYGAEGNGPGGLSV